MKYLPLLLWPLFLAPAFAETTPAQTEALISKEVAEQFKALGGSPKALKHLACVFKNQRQARFPVKEITNKKDTYMVNRCNNLEGGKAEISIHRHDYALVIDFTRPPTSRRMFLVPLDGKGRVESYFTGHGRFGNTSRDNTKATEKGNAIDTLKLFGNKPNSNASATGLFIAGADYIGKYDGPKVEKIKKNKKGKKIKVTVHEGAPTSTLVLHGVEVDVNDNACRRATVIHGTTKISENGKEEGVHLMSSGCPMVSYQAVNRIVDHLKGEQANGGAAILAYGPREAELSDEYYCELRPGQKPDGGTLSPGEDKADDEAIPEEDGESDAPIKQEAHDPLDK